jgi:hypothetical protein
MFLYWTDKKLQRYEGVTWFITAQLQDSLKCTFGLVFFDSLCPLTEPVDGTVLPI